MEKNDFLLNQQKKLQDKEIKFLEVLEKDYFKEYNPFEKFQDEIDTDLKTEDFGKNKEKNEYDRVLEMFEEVKKQMKFEEEKIIQQVKEVKLSSKEQSFFDNPFDETAQFNNIISRYTALYLTKKRIEFKIDSLNRKLIYSSDRKQNSG